MYRYVKSNSVPSVSLDQIIRNAKKAAKRDGYPQVVYKDIYDQFGFIRYYGQKPDWDMKELIKFIDSDGYVMKNVTFDDFGTKELDHRIWPYSVGYFD